MKSSRLLPVSTVGLALSAALAGSVPRAANAQLGSACTATVDACCAARCHAKRLAIWGEWLEHELLYAVPHRQFVFTVPKRLRPFLLHDRKLLGLLCRVASRRAGFRTCCAPPCASP